MKHPLIVNRVRNSVWAIKPETLEAICEAVEASEGNDAPIMAKPSILVEGREEEEMDQKPYDVIGNTAVVPVVGIIGKHLSMLEMACGGASIDAFSAALKQAASDPAVSNVLLYILSPGGVVTGVQETAEVIREIRKTKKVIAYTDDLMCSAAYWLGLQADAVYSSTSATVGSIGVYMLQIDNSRALEMEGVKVNAISAGKWKLLGASFKPLTEEERSVMQAGVDKVYTDFKREVNILRNIKDENLQGQVFDGEEAVEAGLTDGIFNSLEDLIEFLND